jgi:hypothetical protein
VARGEKVGISAGDVFDQYKSVQRGWRFGKGPGFIFVFFFVAVSRLAIWEDMIEEEDCSLPFSAYFLKISKSPSSFDYSSHDFKRV